MEAGMSISGQLFFVVDPVAFFTPILAGGQPQSGFVLVQRESFQVEVTGLANFPFSIPVKLSAPSSLINGTFELPDFPQVFPIETIWVTVSHAGSQHYRSAKFPLANARDGLNIYMYQPGLMPSQGIKAADISTALKSAGLPGNTQISATSWGLNLSGSKSGANIQFGIAIVPDTSPNLGVFLDLSLNGWNIHVGWPADWCESATDVLNSIKSGLQTSGSSTNQAVTNEIMANLEGPPIGLSPALAMDLINAVSIQFITLTFDNNYSWPLSNTTDQTVVVSPALAFGYPRGW
jgi:hypothetical protein